MEKNNEVAVGPSYWYKHGNVRAKLGRGQVICVSKECLPLGSLYPSALHPWDGLGVQGR